jgi:DNA-binding MurR/RpiR family transcriptional regulator
MAEESSVAPGRPLLDRLRYTERGYSGVEEAIARALIADPRRALVESIDAFAERIGVSTGSVVRFAKRLGYSGYRELKYGLAAEPVSPIDLPPGDTPRWGAPMSILTEAIDAQVRALLYAEQAIELEAFDAAADLLVTANHIDFIGVGSAAATALALAFDLSTLGLYCRRAEDPGEAAAAAGFLGPGDVLCVISHSGRTRQSVDAARRARGGGASVIAITSSPRSVLARTAHVTLGIDAAGTRYGSTEFPFRAAHFAVAQALAMAVAARLPAGERGRREARWAEARFDLRYGEAGPDAGTS